MMRRNDERLLGKWASEPGNQRGEDTTLEFKVGGQLDYTVHGTDTDQIMLLTYHVEDNVLVTDQPLHPREERTKFVLTDDGELILLYDDQRWSYRKLPSRCP